MAAAAAAEMQAIVNYTRKSNIVAVDVKMRDCRFAEHGNNIKLVNNGFQLFQWPTKMRNEQFYGASAEKSIADVHSKELCELVRQVTGSELKDIVCFHTQVRNSEIGNRDGSNGVKTPAFVAHCDYSVRTALNMFNNIGGVRSDSLRIGRYLIINAWRSISERSPIMNYHLACCDAQSVVAPDDFISYMGEQAESYRLDPGYNERHRWYYYNQMKKDEVLLFVQYDSDPKAAARYCFHTAFEDPRISNKNTQQQVAPRESIETRIIVFFPNHQPNTIPSMIVVGDELVEQAIQGILNSLLHSDKWPEQGRNWFLSSFQNGNGAKNIIRNMVSNGVTKGLHRLNTATPQQVQQVLDSLLTTNYDEFVRRGKTFESKFK